MITSAKYIKILFAYPMHISTEKLIVVHHKNRSRNLYTFYTVPKEKDCDDMILFKYVADMVTEACQYKDKPELQPIISGYYLNNANIHESESSGVFTVALYYVPKVNKFLDTYLYGIGSVATRWSSMLNSNSITALKKIGPTLTIKHYSPTQVRKNIKLNAVQKLEYKLFKRYV